jgi:hypothetical protein
MIINVSTMEGYTSESVNESNDSFPVICIEEKEYNPESSYGSKDTTIFLVYDRHYDDYVIYGKRHDKRGDYIPYSFRCKSSDDLYHFLKAAIDITSKAKDIYHNIALYNYNNFPLDFSNVTFDFLEKNIDHNYEIFGYNKQYLSRRLIREFLRYCTTMYNRNASGERI